MEQNEIIDKAAEEYCKRTYGELWYRPIGDFKAGAEWHKAQSGWISVKDDMPLYLTKCLVTNGEYVKLSWSKDFDHAWCEIQDGDVDSWLEDVTHWQYLPTPIKNNR